MIGLCVWINIVVSQRSPSTRGRRHQLGRMRDAKSEPQRLPISGPNTFGTILINSLLWQPQTDNAQKSFATQIDRIYAEPLSKYSPEA